MLDGIKPKTVGPGPIDKPADSTDEVCANIFFVELGVCGHKLPRNAVAPTKSDVTAPGRLIGVGDVVVLPRTFQIAKKA